MNVENSLRGKKDVITGKSHPWLCSFQSDSKSVIAFLSVAHIRFGHLYGPIIIGGHDLGIINWLSAEMHVWLYVWVCASGQKRGSMQYVPVAWRGNRRMGGAHRLRAGEPGCAPNGEEGFLGKADPLYIVHHHPC